MKSRNSVLFLFGLFMVSSQAVSQTISLSGSWSLTIGETDLQGGPGSDLNSTYESSGFMSIGVQNGGWFTNWNWKIIVNKSDYNWPDDFILDVRRIGNGFGFGSISGGTSYREVTDVFDENDPFFTGTRNRILISFQYRLRGVSAQVPADTYNTTVYYTVIEI
jgi:hypothetical protein